jgi:flagellar hook-associated protein 2
VQSFVTAYNSLASTIASLRSYNAETKAAGPLLGDAMLRGVEAQLRQSISNPVTGATGSFTTLASLGITTTANGTLALDAKKFEAAMSADPTAAAQVFASAEGIATRIDKLMASKLGTTGEIAARDTGLTSRRKLIDEQKKQVNARMEVIQARYMKQFTALDALLTQMQSTSSFLAQQLASMPAAAG